MKGYAMPTNLRDLNLQRFIFCVSCCVGREVILHLHDFTSFQGIFNAAQTSITPDAKIVLQHARMLSNEANLNRDPEAFKKVDWKSLLFMLVTSLSTAMEGSETTGAVTSSSFALSSFDDSGFQVDSQISQGGREILSRELEPWTAPDEPCKYQELEEQPVDQTWDQFETNSRKFQVKSTYQEDMYTTPLDVTTIPQYVREAADVIAREIETSRQGQVSDNDENDDEEAKYAAVRRLTTNKVASQQPVHAPHVSGQPIVSSQPPAVSEPQASHAHTSKEQSKPEKAKSPKVQSSDTATRDNTRAMGFHDIFVAVKGTQSRGLNPKAVPRPSNRRLQQRPSLLGPLNSRMLHNPYVVKNINALNLEPAFKRANDTSTRNGHNAASMTTHGNGSLTQAHRAREKKAFLEDLKHVNERMKNINWNAVMAQRQQAHAEYNRTGGCRELHFSGNNELIFLDPKHTDGNRQPPTANVKFPTFDKPPKYREPLDRIILEQMLPNVAFDDLVNTRPVWNASSGQHGFKLASFTEILSHPATVNVPETTNNKAQSQRQTLTPSTVPPYSGGPNSSNGPPAQYRPSKSVFTNLQGSYPPTHAPSQGLNGAAGYQQEPTMPTNDAAVMMVSAHPNQQFAYPGSYYPQYTLNPMVVPGAYGQPTFPHQYINKLIPYGALPQTYDPAAGQPFEYVMQPPPQTQLISTSSATECDAFPTGVQAPHPIHTASFKAPMGGPPPRPEHYPNQAVTEMAGVHISNQKGISGLMSNPQVVMNANYQLAPKSLVPGAPVNACMPLQPTTLNAGANQSLVTLPVGTKGVSIGSPVYVDEQKPAEETHGVFPQAESQSPSNKPHQPVLDQACAAEIPGQNYSDHTATEMQVAGGRPIQSVQHPPPPYSSSIIAGVSMTQGVAMSNDYAAFQRQSFYNMPQVSPPSGQPGAPNIVFVPRGTLFGPPQPNKLPQVGMPSLQSIESQQLYAPPASMNANYPIPWHFIAPGAAQSSMLQQHPGHPMMNLSQPTPAMMGTAEDQTSNLNPQLHDNKQMLVYESALPSQNVANGTENMAGMMSQPHQHQPLMAFNLPQSTPGYQTANPYVQLATAYMQPMTADGQLAHYPNAMPQPHPQGNPGAGAGSARPNYPVQRYMQHASGASYNAGSYAGQPQASAAGNVIAMPIYPQVAYVAPMQPQQNGARSQPQVSSKQSYAAN